MVCRPEKPQQCLGSDPLTSTKPPFVRGQQVEASIPHNRESPTTVICHFLLVLLQSSGSACLSALLDTGPSSSSSTRALAYSVAVELQKEQELSWCPKSQASSLHHHGVSISCGTKNVMVAAKLMRFLCIH